MQRHLQLDQSTHQLPDRLSYLPSTHACSRTESCHPGKAPMLKSKSMLAHMQHRMQQACCAV